MKAASQVKAGVRADPPFSVPSGQQKGCETRSLGAAPTAPRSSTLAYANGTVLLTGLRTGVVPARGEVKSVKPDSVAQPIADRHVCTP